MTGAVAIASFSRNSIYKFATIGDTGLPITVPNFCLYMLPLNVKYVVVSMNSHNYMISWTFNIVRSTEN